MNRTVVSSTPRRRIILERHYTAAVEDVWALWTTKEGIESWWGPDGFFVTVHSIDLRPGGELRYAMTAKAPEMVAFMKANHMPVTQELLIKYVEVVEHRRLRYLNWADFIPDVEPYNVETLVELHASADGGVRMVLTLEAMHDDMWTGRAVAGWESEIGRLGRVLEARKS